MYIFPKFCGTVRVWEILCLLLGALLLPPCSMLLVAPSITTRQTESCNLSLKYSKPTERHQAHIATLPRSLTEESFGLNWSFQCPKAAFLQEPPKLSEGRNRLWGKMRRMARQTSWITVVAGQIEAPAESLEDSRAHNFVVCINLPFRKSLSGTKIWKRLTTWYHVGTDIFKLWRFERCW